MMNRTMIKIHSYLLVFLILLVFGVPFQAQARDDTGRSSSSMFQICRARGFSMRVGKLAAMVRGICGLP